LNAKLGAPPQIDTEEDEDFADFDDVEDLAEKLS
jgi:hypothetical protein